MKRSLIHLFSLLGLLLLFVGSAYGTHNRAGEITYKHIQGFEYEITVLTCTDNSLATNADREWIPIYFGYGIENDSIQRTSELQVGPGIKRNLYVTTHSFPGPGTYAILMEDMNRNANVENIPESIEETFSITTVLVINPLPTVGPNNSVQMLNPPKGDGCVGSPWFHNPAAFDVDGDSLGYELVLCTGDDGLVIPGTVFPNFISGFNETLEIDPISGTTTWDFPNMIGLYNLCIRITEYRNIDGVTYVMGSVVRDMQLAIRVCDNEPPEINPIPDTCVVAGSPLQIGVETNDPDGDAMTIEMNGESFTLPAAESPSIFTQMVEPNPAQGTFSWSTMCNHVRLQPYGVYVNVFDQVPTNQTLSNTSYFEITVIAPPVQNVMAMAQNGLMELQWDQSVCDEAIGYKIYRSLGPNPYSPGPCETGIPSSTGYELIDQVSGLMNTEYTDTDVPFGFEVCYRISACFADGAESIISEESCSVISREIPVIIKSSVGFTDVSVGRDTLRWLAPNEIDTTVITGPYFYKVYRTVGLTGTEELIETTTPTAILDNQIGLDVIDTDINSEEFAHSYRVEFLVEDSGQEVSISSSNDAPTIFLQSAPQDGAIELSWSDFQPWNNFEYEIWHSAGGGAAFTFLDATTDTFYLHDSLVNGELHCYYIRALGEYDPLSMISGPLVNFSQEKCDAAIDLTPPCPPVLDFTGLCLDGNYELSWTDPNDFCADDVTEYNLYYAPTVNSEFELLTTIGSSTDTSYTPEEEFPIGCYFVTALDTRVEANGTLVMNESDSSNVVCLEGCPEYELPNVISPNGDTSNDLFQPFDPWGYVSEIDLKIYNRWGNLLFETTDPQIDWNATNMDNGELVSDGVYFYHIAIFELTLEGAIPRFENGTIHIFDNTGTITE